jgi:glycosyltransferase involved in cell wall biosynthesis
MFDLFNVSTENADILVNLLVRVFGIGMSSLIAIGLVNYSTKIFRIIGKYSQNNNDIEINPRKGYYVAALLNFLGILLIVMTIFDYIILGIFYSKSSQLPFLTYLHSLSLIFISLIVIQRILSSLDSNDIRIKISMILIYVFLPLLTVGFAVNTLNELDVFDTSESVGDVVNLLHFYLPLFVIIVYCCSIGMWLGFKYLKLKPSEGLDLPELNVDPSDLRLCIYIPAYNAARTLPNLIERIPKTIEGSINDIVVIDDSSPDNTYLLALGLKRQSDLANMDIYRTVTNQRYGGNQKLGYAYALVKEYDVVIMLHGDAQYAPELIPLIIEPFVKKEADMVFGSRIKVDPLKGGMPPIKYIGNRVLTFIENKVLGLNLSEFHSGYRAYSVEALKKIPFLKCTNEFHFDTEIIIQMKKAGLRIKEVSIPTYYGEEESAVNKMQYGFDILNELIVFYLDKKGIIFSDKYHTDNFEQPKKEELEEYLNDNLLVVQ